MLALRNPNDPRNLKEVIDALTRQFDNTGSFNLSNSTTTTRISNPKVSSISKVLLEPRTLAASAIRNQIFISSISDGEFVINHPSATTVRTFDYVIHGV